MFLYILEGEWRVLIDSEVQRYLNWNIRADVAATIGSVPSKENRRRRANKSGKPNRRQRR